ncbi:hypothetical protein [Winogradskyella sp. SM1960]|uniref:hypothetical protein n=1 Tax=Winogradskyella sp. SM1960 TaxID=2865955 RepID=UPI001CD39887|nr:hypothetical protein [Winogradskyella sp. SM1960]
MQLGYPANGEAYALPKKAIFFVSFAVGRMTMKAPIVIPVRHEGQPLIYKISCHVSGNYQNRVVDMRI